MSDANFARLVCGVDEAGRGPLAGPVFAAAVVLDDRSPILGLDDSKRLSPKRRTELAAQIRKSAHVWAVAHATVEEIDRLNILKATMLAMVRAVSAIQTSIQADLGIEGRSGPLSGPLAGPLLALIDGNQLPTDLPCPGCAIIGGDAKIPAISAASILAKTERDLMMGQLAIQWPGYGFEIHQGYGTRAHLEALNRLGPCPEHRRSFAPVRARLGLA
jgi:ribonuclease HII